MSNDDKRLLAQVSIVAIMAGYGAIQMHRVNRQTKKIEARLNKPLPTLDYNPLFVKMP